MFQNTAAQLGGRVIGIFLSTGTLILLARYLGIAGAIVNMLLNPVLIPRYGALGAS